MQLINIIDNLLILFINDAPAPYTKLNHVKLRTLNQRRTVKPNNVSLPDHGNVYQ